MRSLLIFLLILVPIPAIFIKPHIGVLIWTWVSYMNPHRLTFGPAFNFPFLDIIAPATLIALFVSKEPKALPNHPVVWLLGLFGAFVTLTTFTGIIPELGWDKWELFMKVLLFTLLTIIMINSPGRLHAFIWIIVLSLGYFAVKGGLFTLIRGGTGIVWGPSGSFLADNNQLALAIIMYVPILGYLYTRYENRLVKFGIGAMFMFSLIAILGSQSRGALVAIVAMLGFLVIKSRHRLFAGMAILIVSVGGIIFMPQEWRDRMETITAFEQDDSAMGRVEMWKFATDVARDRPLGGGYQVFYSPEERARLLPIGVEGRASHSIFFETLGEHGYGGLFLFLLIWTTAYFSASRTVALCRKYHPGHWAGDLSRMLQVSIVGYAVAGSFLNLGTFDLYYHMVALIVIAQLLLLREIATGEEKPLTFEMPFDFIGRKKEPTRIPEAGRFSA